MKLHVVLALLLFAQNTNAEVVEQAEAPAVDQSEDDIYSRSGAYFQIGVAGSYFTELEDDTEALTGGTVDIDVEVIPGIDLHGGYRLNRFFAAEINFQWFPSADIKIDGRRKFELDTWTFTGGLKIYPLMGRVQPFGRFGYGAMRAKFIGRGVREDAKLKDDVIRIGGGVDIYITESFVLVFEASNIFPTGDVKGLDQLVFGGGVMLRM